MKTILLSASVLSISAVAQAQMVFEGGEISANVIFPIGDGFSDFNKYGVDGKVAISFGSIGIQADFGYDTIIGNDIPINIDAYDVGIHTYYKISESIKAGVFYTNEQIDSGGGGNLGLITYGAEVAFNFGKLDTEISIGKSGDSFIDGMIVEVDAYYQLSGPFSLNAGIWTLIEAGAGGDVFGIATFGASYSLENAPVTIGLSYSSGFFSGGVGPQGSSIEARVSYSFGGNGGRLFKTRNIDYLSLIMALGGA